MALDMALELPLEIWNMISDKLGRINLIFVCRLKLTQKLFLRELSIPNTPRLISDVKLTTFPKFFSVNYHKDGIFLNITKRKNLDVGKYNNEYVNYSDDDDFGWYLIKKILINHKQLTRTAVCMLLETKTCCIEQAILQLRGLRMIKID